MVKSPSVSIMRLSFVLRFVALLPLFAFHLAPAAAQDVYADPGVLRRLETHAHMGREDAVEALRIVNARLAANASRGGDRYDDMRQTVNRAIYGSQAGPGANRVEYETRLSAVLGRLSTGLDVPSLVAFFAPYAEANGSLRCASTWGLTVMQCDALVAAAREVAAPVPFAAPDRGAGLREELRDMNIDRREVEEVATGLYSLMASIPNSLTNDASGRAILELMAVCPGGLSGREAQFRAWNQGPTTALSACIAAHLAANGGVNAIRETFGFSLDAARAFVRYGRRARRVGGPAVASATEPHETTPEPNPSAQRGPAANARGPAVAALSDADSLRQQGRAQFRLGNLEAALQAYRGAAEQEPNHAGTQSAIGFALLQLHRADEAAVAYRRAVELEPNNPSFHVALGRALAEAGQRDEAIAALQQAMRIDYDFMPAREGLRALGGEPPPAPLPDVPSRAQIIGTLRPLGVALQECEPGYHGRIAFVIVIEGPTGAVQAVAGDPSEEISPDGQACMELVVQGATFPRFTQDMLSITYPFELEGS